jgi:hypothetical protein
MNAPVLISITVDPREALLARAAAREALYQAGELDLGEAFDGLIEPFLEIIFPRPVNHAETYWDSPGWARATQEYHASRKQRWGWR